MLYYNMIKTEFCLNLICEVKTMRKAITIILCFVMICGYAVAEDYSELSTEELHDRICQIRNELEKRELLDGNNDIIFDNNGVKIYLTGKYEKKGTKIRIEIIIINESEYEIAINPELSVNGWDVGFMSWKTDAKPGMKAKGYFEFEASAAEITTYEEIEEIVFWYKARFGGSGKDWISIDPITVYFNNTITEPKG